MITTVAGNGTAGFGGDNGAATSAQLNSPSGIAVDTSGNLYITDTANQRIRKVSNGVITTVAGSGTAGFAGDNGPAISARLNSPSNVAIDASGNLYIADTANRRIRRVSNGVITTAVGNGTQGFSGDNGAATSAQMGPPYGIAVDVAGNLYFADTFLNHRVRKVSNGVITTVAGSGLVGDNGPATSGQLNQPQGVAVDSAGNLYIGDSQNSRIRKVSGGVIDTLAGNGTFGFSGDNGPATSAQLNTPYGVAVDSSGNLYTADFGNNRIRKVANGVISTVAGNGTPGFSGDNGPATTAQLNQPADIAVDAAGNLYIAEQGNHRVRKVSGGVITTVAGSGTPGFSGDDGPATGAQLNQPEGLTVDFAGNLYIADENNHRIRKVSNGVITTVAGNGTLGFSGDNGPAASAQMALPRSLAVDSAGSLYFADFSNARIRKVSNGVITTIAGSGNEGVSGDNGPATSALLDQPYGVAVDPAGNVYFADSGNNRIRLLTPSTLSCTYSLTPTSLQSPASGGSFTVAIQTTATCSWTISNLPNWITVSGASSGTGPATITLIVAPNTSGAALNATISVAGVSLTVTQAGGQATYTCTNTTPPVITSVDSAGSYGGYSYFASGSWLEIKGTNLADPADPRLTAATNPGQWASNDFNGANAPTTLDGISVSINGKPAYVWYLSATQLNVQAPEDSATGSIAITVTNCKATSQPLTFARRPLAPGILAPTNYTAGGTQYMVATFASDGAYVLNTSTGAALGLNSRPAKPGDLIVAYGIGFGDVTPSILPGVIVQQTNALANPVTISFGSTNATLVYSGLAGSFVGLYEFYITVPPGLANGDYQINVTQNGTAVPQAMYLTVHN
ncbi:MAG TPA: BACON domain-containing carbohydrate-binding protein [Candidatus Acidoferrales bacterium]|nr:BACON domain-containing carbohydrate-binding protein [Candidatus Acidoferrales bacterium]